MPRPPEMTILAAVSSGRSDLASSSATNADLPASAEPDSFNSSRTAFGGHWIKTCATHGDHFYRRSRLHGSNGVAGVDRTHKGVGADHGNDFRDLINIQLSGNPRQDVFAVGSRASQDVAVALTQFGNQRGNVFRQLMGVSRIVSHQHFSHASNFGGSFSGSAASATGNQYVNVATYGLRRGNSVQRGSSDSSV